MKVSADGGAFAANATDVWVSTALNAFNTTAGPGEGTNVTFKWPETAGAAFGVP